MGIESFVLAIILVSLILYAVLGGADFGGGIWEFHLALQAGERERRLIHGAIGPVWEANHVWLIFVIVLLVNAFPAAFAGLARALWLPLLLALTGIVFRGASFAFRSYAMGRITQQAVWSTVFALASTAAPFFLGASVGAIASGDLIIEPDGTFQGDYLTDWISPLSIFSAFFAVGMFTYLAAFYLTREAALIGDSEMTALWRRRSLSVGIWMGILAGVGLVLLAIESPMIWEGFVSRAWPATGLSVGAGLFSLAAIWRSRFTLAVAASATAVGAILLGWGIAQWPYLVPPSLTIADAKAPDTVLRAILWSVGLGAVLLIPSLAYLLYLFKTASR